MGNSGLTELPPYDLPSANRQRVPSLAPPSFLPVTKAILCLRNLSFCFSLDKPQQILSTGVGKPVWVKDVTFCVHGLSGTRWASLYFHNLKQDISTFDIFPPILRIVRRGTGFILFPGIPLFFSVSVSQQNQAQDSQTHPHGHPNHHGIPSEIRQTHQQAFPTPFPGCGFSIAPAASEMPPKKGRAAKPGCRSIPVLRIKYASPDADTRRCPWPEHPGRAPAPPASAHRPDAPR